MKKKNYRAINFDLDTHLLKLNYPNKDYRQAYKDIGRFLISNGFEHRQGSGYVTVNSLSKDDIISLTEKLFRKFDWLEKCAKKIDSTIIAQEYDLIELHNIVKSDTIVETNTINIIDDILDLTDEDELGLSR